MQDWIRLSLYNSKHSRRLSVWNNAQPSIHRQWYYVVKSAYSSSTIMLLIPQISNIQFASVFGRRIERRKYSVMMRGRGLDGERFGLG